MHITSSSKATQAKVTTSKLLSSKSLVHGLNISKHTLGWKADLHFSNSNSYGKWNSPVSWSKQTGKSHSSGRLEWKFRLHLMQNRVGGQFFLPSWNK
ncbi:hypothetical protein TNCV_2331941 [Trichonephila clavipes]|nr:hypothetical protein TNCV_2331941 [Trichonephila clavipes]